MLEELVDATMQRAIARGLWELRTGRAVPEASWLINFPPPAPPECFTEVEASAPAPHEEAP